MANPPQILDLKRNSLDDGPGIRTTIFFKGCPLSCAWCHNPESKRAIPELAFRASDCIRCDRCLDVCPHGAIRAREPATGAEPPQRARRLSVRRLLDLVRRKEVERQDTRSSSPRTAGPAAFDRIDRTLCQRCFTCTTVCPSGALSRLGQPMEVASVVEVIRKDLAFFRNSGGGVTLSGGEPTLYTEYCADLLERCKALGVHTLVETCGNFEMEVFERQLFPWLDAIYFDLKLIDPEQHRRFCGRSNETILANAKHLAKRTRADRKVFLPRVPLVPGITDGDENLEGIARFLSRIGLNQVVLLPYNPTWASKAHMIGVQPIEIGDQWTNDAELARCRACFEGFEVG
ncbi:MAG: glycyl-radical enzyme activating protein [Bradymonadales bacterium]|nr:glycyl-radical enzyme activating protein [Bradymonadales bacterium]